MSTLAWALAVIGLVLAGYLGVRAERAETRAEKAEQTLQSIERLSEAADGFLSARFVRADDQTIMYSVPRQVQVDGQTFVEYAEQTATYGPELVVFGPFIKEQSAGEAIRQLPAGKDINIKYVSGTEDSATPRIESVYVAL